jgi:ribosomal protein L37AE/L43A
LSERGKIRNREYASQIRDFSGLKYGTITPTDVDMAIDFGNKAFVWGELKHGDTPITPGQRLFLERVNDALERSGIPSYVLSISHKDSGDIDVANARVVEYRSNGQWRKPRGDISVKDAVTKIKETGTREFSCHICDSKSGLLWFEGKWWCETCYLAEAGWRKDAK